VRREGSKSDVKSPERRGVVLGEKASSSGDSGVQSPSPRWRWWGCLDLSDSEQLPLATPLGTTHNTGKSYAAYISSYTIVYIHQHDLCMRLLFILTSFITTDCIALLAVSARWMASIVTRHYI